MDETKAKKILKKVVEDYNSIADGFDKTRKNEWKEFEIFLPYIKDKSNLADIGCGNGRFFKFLNQHKKVNYVGIDNSSKLLDKAKSKYKDISFILGDMLEIPLNNETQDIVCNIAAFHHLPSNELRIKAIKEFFRVLKKDGFLFLTVWNLYQKKYEKYIGLDKNYGKQDALIPWGNSGINRYYYAFKFKELKELLELCFKVVKHFKGNNLIFICKKK